MGGGFKLQKKKKIGENAGSQFKSAWKIIAGGKMFAQTVIIPNLEVETFLRWGSVTLIYDEDAKQQPWIALAKELKN